MSPTSFVMGFAEFGGELYAAGSFSEAGGNAVQNIAKWNGTSWSAVGLGISSGSISSIAVYNGALYVAGQFSMAGGNPIKNIAKWDGSNWSGLSSGIDDRLYTLKVFNNELYAGGQFNTAGGNTISGIARWNGTSWNSLGSGGNFNVASLIEYDNKLYVGGTISNVGGIPVKNIASWDGLAWDSVGSGIRDVINTTPIVKGLAVYNGALIAGGCFSLFSGGPNDYISKFTITTAVKPEIASIKDLSVFPNPVEAGGKLNVKSDAPFSMTAYSLTGDKVLEVSYEMNQQVQLPHLSKGLYILAIHSAQGTAHRKLVVE